MMTNTAKILKSIRDDLLPQSDGASRFERASKAIAIVLALAVAGLAIGGHPRVGHQRQHCAACATGNCRVQHNTFGYYQAHWRPWNGTNKVYEGFRKPAPKIDVPAPQIPVEIDEARIEPRTRAGANISTGEGPNAILNTTPAPTSEVPSTDDLSVPGLTPPGDDGGLAPANPFDNVVPEVDVSDVLPNDPGLTPPAESSPAPIGDDLFGPLPGLEGDSNTDDALPELDADDLFGPTGSTTPNRSSLSARVIKNRPLKQQTFDLDRARVVDRPVQASLIEIPPYSFAGSDGATEFSAADLLPPNPEAKTIELPLPKPVQPAAESKRDSATFANNDAAESNVDHAENDQPAVVDEANSMQLISHRTELQAADTVSTEMGNPLRQSGNGFIRESEGEINATHRTTPKQLTPVQDKTPVQLEPVPKEAFSKHVSRQQQKIMQASAEMPIADSNENAKPRNENARSLASAGRRSLRSTLRKNPLR